MSQPNPNDPQTPPTPAPAAPIITAEELKALRDRNAQLEAENANRRAQEDNSRILTEFPSIKDPSVLVGKDYAEKRAFAEKLVKSFAPPAPPAPAPETPPAPQPPAPAPASPFNGMPPLGPQGGVEGLPQQEQFKKKQEMVEAVKTRNLDAVLDGCIALSPKQTQNLYIPGVK